MQLRQLWARGWRNLEPLELRPSPRLTVLYGDNGQGKSNVIEAVYYLATMRSFRTSHAEDLIQHALQPQGSARLRAQVTTQGLDRRLELELGPAGRVVTLDGKIVRGAAAVFGAVSVVLFVPDDLLLPRAAPSARRRFLDLAVFNVERSYYKEASAFQKVLKSRNVLLRKGRPSRILLETYDEELARTGARVILRRRALVHELGPRLQTYFKALHGDLPVDLRYQSGAVTSDDATESAIQAALLAGLVQRHEVDERRRFTGFGPQTDDLELYLAGRLAREHASQGQLRSLVLALKLAELTNVEAKRGDAPVLLLDDVPSELDPHRRAFLFQMLGTLSCQTFISVADRSIIPPLSGRDDFEVVGGVVRHTS